MVPQMDIAEVYAYGNLNSLSGSQVLSTHDPVDANSESRFLTDPVHVVEHLHRHGEGLGRFELLTAA